MTASCTAFGSLSDSTPGATPRPSPPRSAAAPGRSPRAAARRRLVALVTRRRSRPRRRRRRRPAAGRTPSAARCRRPGPRSVSVPSSSPRSEVELLGRAGGRRERAGPGQLVVAARRGRAQVVRGQRRSSGSSRRPRQSGSAYSVERQLHLAVQRLHDADVGLLADAGQHQRQVVAGRAARRRGSCPRPRPSTARAAARSAKSPRCSVTKASECSSRRTLAYDRSSSLSSRSRPGAPTSSGTAVSSPSTSSSIRSVRTSLRARRLVQADRDAVRAQRRLALRARGQRRGLLADREGGDGTGRVRLDLRAQDVDAGRLQPRLRPGLQVAAGGLLQGAQQVGQAGVAERVRLKYACTPAKNSSCRRTRRAA